MARRTGPSPVRGKCQCTFSRNSRWAAEAVAFETDLLVPSPGTLVSVVQLETVSRFLNSTSYAGPAEPLTPVAVRKLMTKFVPIIPLELNRTGTIVFVWPAKFLGLLVARTRLPRPARDWTPSVGRAE